jgi:hypothetical protein
MLQATEALARRSWSHPLEHTGEEWWADVLADPRARRQTRDIRNRSALTAYRLRDEPRSTILVACTKCDWKAAYNRDALILLHGATRVMPDLLNDLAAPDRLELGSLRRVFCRADRGAAMTTLTLRMVKDNFVVTGPDIEPMRFVTRREAKDWCLTHHPGSPIKEVSRRPKEKPSEDKSARQ